jgi:putative transcriptional regulator
MPYKPITIDRKNLTIMGVRFPDLETLDSAANAIGSNMFEGFEPTEKLIELYRDYRAGKISNSQLITLIKDAV